MFGMEYQIDWFYKSGGRDTTKGFNLEHLQREIESINWEVIEHIEIKPWV